MKFFAALLTFALIFSSCSSTTKDQIKEDRMSVGSIDKDTMIMKMREMLDRIPGITKDQTDKLLNMHATVYEESQEINRRIYQNKVLLFKYLAESKTKEMNMVRSDIKSLYNKKLDVMFRAFDDVQNILGKDTHKILMEEDFRMYHGFSHDRF